jgi:hypothetical protein
VTKDIHNEHVKLVAGALNNLAVATAVAAVIAPGTSGTLTGGWHIVVTIAWLLFALALHLTGQFALGAME